MFRCSPWEQNIVIVAISKAFWSDLKEKTTIVLVKQCLKCIIRHHCAAKWCRSYRAAFSTTIPQYSDEWNEEELLESLFNLLTLYSIYPLNIQSHCNVQSLLLFILIITPSLASALDKHRKQLKRCQRSARLKLLCSEGNRIIRCCTLYFEYLISSKSEQRRKLSHVPLAFLWRSSRLSLITP